MADVAGQAVRHVHGARRDAAQRASERDARLRHFHPQADFVELRRAQRQRAAEHLQRQPRIAERAADPDLVARLRARAQQRLARWHFAHRRDVDVERPRRRVAAGEHDVMRVRELEQPLREPRQEGFVDARQRQRQEEGLGRRAAGGEVAEVHRQRLVTEPSRRHRRQEVPTFDQHVRRHQPLMARRRRQYRAVVADAQRHGPALGPAGAPRAAEESVDQVELAQRTCVAALARAGGTGTGTGNGGCTGSCAGRVRRITHGRHCRRAGGWTARPRTSRPSSRRPSPGGLPPCAR